MNENVNVEEMKTNGGLHSYQKKENTRQKKENNKQKTRMRIVQNAALYENEDNEGQNQKGKQETHTRNRHPLPRPGPLYLDIYRWKSIV